MSQDINSLSIRTGLIAKIYPDKAFAGDKFILIIAINQNRLAYVYILAEYKFW